MAEIEGPIEAPVNDIEDLIYDLDDADINEQFKTEMSGEDEQPRVTID